MKSLSTNDSQVFEAVMKAESEIKELILEGRCQRQSKLTDYTFFLIRNPNSNFRLGSSLRVP